MSQKHLYTQKDDIPKEMFVLFQTLFKSQMLAVEIWHLVVPSHFRPVSDTWEGPRVSGLSWRYAMAPVLLWQPAPDFHASLHNCPSFFFHFLSLLCFSLNVIFITGRSRIQISARRLDIPTDKYSFGKEMSPLSWSPTFHCCFHKIPPYAPSLNQFNSIHVVCIDVSFVWRTCWFSYGRAKQSVLSRLDRSYQNDSNMFIMAPALAQFPAQWEQSGFADESPGVSCAHLSSAWRYPSLRIAVYLLVILLLQ